MTAQIEIDVVLPPRAGTGLRHAVRRGGERTLCGINADGWYLDRPRHHDPDLHIGCKRCQRAIAALETKDDSATIQGVRTFDLRGRTVCLNDIFEAAKRGVVRVVL